MFKIVYFCPECCHSLSKHQVHFSAGCCPYCGHISGTSVCSHESRSEEYSDVAQRAWLLMAAVIFCTGAAAVVILSLQ